ncbi:MAG: ASCH domain-containing protein [Planctomycetota bacterium]
MSEPLDRGRIALGVRQPWAELIVRGVKTLEVRSRPTEQRGPIYIYAAKKWAEHDFADGVASRHGVDRDAVPYGRVVGAVTVTGCREARAEDVAASLVPADYLREAWVWELADATRLSEPVKPRFLPYGVWFYPLKRRPQNSPG